MQEQIAQLEARIAELEKQISNMNSLDTITYEMENALIARGFVSANDFNSVKQALLAHGGVESDVFYGAPSSGAPATTLITVVDGIITTT